MTSASGPSSPHGDLLRIRRALESSNPELYRQLALYLQVLRQILPLSVDQACFHLATQVQPARYISLSEAQRRRFHANVSALVARCTTLLTVEQLICLAARIAREEAAQAERFLRDSPGSRQRDQDATSEAGAGAPPPSSPVLSSPMRPAHQASVNLGLDLPIEAGWLGWSEVPGFAAADPSDESCAEAPQDSEPRPPDMVEETDEDATASDLFNLFSALASAAGMENGLRGLEVPTEPSMEEFSGQADAETDGEPISSEGEPSGSAAGPPGEGPFPFRFRALTLETDSSERSAANRLGEDDPGALYRPPKEGGLLPRDPVALQAWLEGVELALARQLRDLSHALNGELLRSGLIRILLPLNLLEGVLRGQIDVQSSHPNLLQLPLPIPHGRSGRLLRAQVILLRRADLELEQPRLRTVRSRLQQHRQEGRKMALQYHRLQRRIQAHEAEALWLQDIRSMRPDPDPRS